MSLKVGYFTRETVVSLRRNLLMTLAGVLTVAVSLFLFGGVQPLSRMVDHATPGTAAIHLLNYVLDAFGSNHFIHPNC